MISVIPSPVFGRRAGDVKPTGAIIHEREPLAIKKTVAICTTNQQTIHRAGEEASIERRPSSHLTPLERSSSDAKQQPQKRRLPLCVYTSHHTRINFEFCGLLYFYILLLFVVDDWIQEEEVRVVVLMRLLETKNIAPDESSGSVMIVLQPMD